MGQVGHRGHGRWPDLPERFGYTLDDDHIATLIRDGFRHVEKISSAPVATARSVGDADQFSGALMGTATVDRG
jgi:hypothetical protein